MKTSSQTALKVLSIIGIVVGAIIAGAFNVVVGVFGVRGANDPSKIGVFWVLCIIGIVFNALGLIMEATGSGISASSLIGTLFVVVLFILANNIKKQA